MDPGEIETTTERLLANKKAREALVDSLNRIATALEQLTTADDAFKRSRSRLREAIERYWAAMERSNQRFREETRQQLVELIAPLHDRVRAIEQRQIREDNDQIERHERTD